MLYFHWSLLISGHTDYTQPYVMLLYSLFIFMLVLGLVILVLKLIYFG